MKKNSDAANSIDAIISDLLSRKKRRGRKRKTQRTASSKKWAKTWKRVGSRIAYQRAAAKASCHRTTEHIENEFFDGIFLNLRCSENKSYNMQKRILRRIVEKRQAQSAYHSVRHSQSRFSEQLTRHCVSVSMGALRRFCLFIN